MMVNETNEVQRDREGVKSRDFIAIQARRREFQFKLVDSSSCGRPLSKRVIKGYRLKHEKGVRRCAILQEMAWD